MYDKSAAQDVIQQPNENVGDVPPIEIAATAPVLIAVDIGNSGIKLGRFPRSTNATGEFNNDSSTTKPLLAEPTAILELPIAHATGSFDSRQLGNWCQVNASSDTHWFIGSVHRGAGALLAATIETWASQLGVDWPIRRLTSQDLPIPIRLDEPTQVGVDRLLAAMAVNRLRAADRAAIVVDLGTAITVDLVAADGAFEGGAILPGVGMASRALADQTDALPHIALERAQNRPSSIGKSTKAAIEAGLYWGAVGAIKELVSRISAKLSADPDVFITGGAAPIVVDAISEQTCIRFVPHLVLSGIALLETPAEPAHKG
jgi:type III pantothenate kinase